MPHRLLVANRGEIAVRVIRTARELGVPTVAVHGEDDAGALHVRLADDAVALTGSGPAPYLDAAQLLDAALRTGCDAVHPGYGFLSEQAHFARRCDEAGLRFVGPHPEVLAVFGDKAQARSLADRVGVPLLAGTDHPTSLDEARAVLTHLGPGAAVVVKALAGGGGRGLRVARDHVELEEAYERCRSEALAAFGDDRVYVEELLPRARHLEIQVLGDRAGAVSHLGDRECTLQRRRQKLVELAPSAAIPAALRERLVEAALRLAAEVRLDNLATVELLVDAAGPLHDGTRFAFLEANPRIQVEHTVTEEVTGLDLVATQLALADGSTLAELALDDPTRHAPRGAAVQLRVNAETLRADGSLAPAAGTVTAFVAPSGPGIRVDTAAEVGTAVSPRFDSLLAKLVLRSARPDALPAKALAALEATRIEGVATNLGLLQALVAHPAVLDDDITTTFVEDHLAELVEAAATLAPTAPSLERGDGTVVAAPLSGTVVAVDVAPGDAVAAGQQVAVIEAMKMEHVVGATVAGTVRDLGVAVGQTVAEGAPLVAIEPGGAGTTVPVAAEAVDLERIRSDLAELFQRHHLTRDDARPDAVDRRRRTGHRTARENIADLIDPGSFVEYGSLVIAAQRRRRSLDDLIARTPADGLVGGTARVNGLLFPDERARCVVVSYDYTVLAGTQGMQNHRKKDRLFELAERQRLPVVLFAEGGGGRPGDTDAPGVAGLDCLAFWLFGGLSGLVPLVGIASGRCFAGNAALLGCCDVVIATRDATIGMGGPAMIEGGGLGVYRPEEVGPIDVQVPNGVVDVAVADEAEAVLVAKRYLSYFQGAVDGWECADQRLLRTVIPENRLRVHDVRRVIDLLADTDSVLELRRGFAPGMITALVRVEGRPLGVVANNPTHLAGAIDSEGADKAARFLQLCDAHDLPVLFLCDTPGIMVGPDAERTALVRHASRLFVTGASLTVPFLTIILRKGYGLGAQAMAGGSFKAPLLTVAWPTGEFGGMGLEGAVKLGFRSELEAVSDPAERRALFEEMVARMYEHGKALNMASHFEIDDVIDPADSRRMIVEVLRSAPPSPARSGKKRPCVDAW